MIQRGMSYSGLLLGLILLLLTDAGLSAAHERVEKNSAAEPVSSTYALQVTSGDRDFDGIADNTEITGWSNNGGGPYITDPADPDSDDDGLSDGEEQLFNTQPLDEKNPGIYVRYDPTLHTQKYFPWQKYGDKYIAHGNATYKSVVVRRGAVFSVDGPKGAVLEIQKSQSSLTTLTAVEATCGGGWTVSVPTNGTVGKYVLKMSAGSWSKTLNLYVIFELPAGLTSAETAAYLYADDLADDRDKYAAWIDTSYNTNYTDPNYEYYGLAYPFGTDQYERYVFEDYVLGTINGKTNLQDAFTALAHKTDQVTRFDANVAKYNMQTALASPENRNQCSGVATVLVGFARSAGIPSRAIITDWQTRHYDTSTEGWTGNTWVTTRAWNSNAETSGGSIEGGIYGPYSQYYYGHNKYTASNSAIISTLGPNWIWNDVNNLYGQGHCGFGSKRVYKTWYLREQGSESPPAAPGTIEHGPGWKPLTAPYWGWPTEPATDRLIANGCTPTLVPTQFSVDTPSPVSLAALATQPQLARFNRVVQDYGLDLDGNGRYEVLVIEVEVEAGQPGDYTIIGHLADKTPTPLTVNGYLASASTYTHLSAGSQVVKLQFNGLTLYQNGEDGAYTLDELWLSDKAYPEEVDLAGQAVDYQSPQYQTAFYSRDNFENGGAALTHNYRYTPVDGDGDGYVDTLLLNTGLNINRSGTYRVEAELVDSAGQLVTRATWTGTGDGLGLLPFKTFLPLIFKSDPSGSGPKPLAASGQPVLLQFEALLGDVTAYQIQNINLYNERGELIGSDYQSSGLNPPAYVLDPLYAAGLTAQAQTQASQTVVANAAGRDSDQDGDWDSLDFTVRTVVAVAGNYRLEAWLADRQGALLAWQTSQPVNLPPGLHEMQLSFPGQMINAAQAAGPYKLIALKVLWGDGYKVIDKLDEAYETTAFSPADFDQSLNGSIPGGGADKLIQDAALGCPNVYFTSSSPDLLGEPTVFTNGSSGSNLTFAWDFGDGSPIDPAVNPSHTYTATGAYTVRLTATGGGVSDTAIQQVVIETLAPPLASFNSSSPDILGETTVFTNTSSGNQLRFAWDFGDGSPVVSTIHTTHTYNAVGVYTTLLTITNPLGSSTASGQITINPQFPNLRGYWSLDESSGQRLDQGTLANHLSDVNTVAAGTGRVNLAADFESSNKEYLTIANTTQTGLNITGDLTLVGWINLESLGQTMIMAGKYDYGTNNRAYRFGVFDTKVLHFAVSPDGTYVSGTNNLDGKTVLQTGRWYHTAAVFDANVRTLRLYLDGVLEATKTVSYNRINVSTAPFILGANLQGSSVVQYFDGLLDDWRVYGQALSQSQIQELMNGGTTPTPTFTPTPTSTFTPIPPTPTSTFTPDPEATFTPTPTFTPVPPTSTPTPTFTPTSIPTATPVQSADLIFADGFESGNLSAWSSSKMDGGDLSASSVAALRGGYGLQAVINDAAAIYVTDESPSSEARYRARFYFDPNSIKMAGGDTYTIFYGYTVTSTATAMLVVDTRFSSGSYQVRVGVQKDAGVWQTGSWYLISDAPHAVELDWQAAAAPGANNGSLTFWLDGTQRTILTGVDNDTRRVDRIRLGAVGGIDSGTAGTVYFDAFESRRQNYIGP